MLKKLLLTAVACFAAVTLAEAASLTLPSFTVSGIPPSTAIACSAISSTLVALVPAGTVLTKCTVSPANWTGAVSLSSDPQFVITGLAGNTFNVAVGATPLSAGSYTPGTVQSVP